MELTKYDVFISYRRKGGSAKAQLVKSELKQRGVKEERIFLDTHSLHDGDFEQKIKVAIEQSQCVVVIISEGCFDEIKDTDFWYMEIKEALLQGKRVVPIFFDSITSFTNLNVPYELNDLTKKNAITYQHEYAEATFNKLLSFIGLEESSSVTQQPNQNSYSELLSNQGQNKGCLFSFRYKGCLVSVVLVCLVCFVITSITFFSNNNYERVGKELSKTIRHPSSHHEYYGNANYHSQMDTTSSSCYEDIEDAALAKSASEDNLDIEDNRHINERLYGDWYSIQDTIIQRYSFYQKIFVYKLSINGSVIDFSHGEYKIVNNRILFIWPEKKQTVRFILNGNELKLLFSSNKTIVLTKEE